MTDNHFWSVICIPGKLECPFSFPWLSGQVIRLRWYELLPRGLQLHLQGHMIIKQTAQDFPGTPSNFMRRIQTNSCPKNKPCLHLPALFSWSLCVWLESFCVLRACFADVVLPPTSTYNSALFFIPAGPTGRCHPQCCDTDCSSLLLGEFSRMKTPIFSLCASALSGVISVIPRFAGKVGKGINSTVFEG